MPQPAPAKEEKVHWSRKHITENLGLILAAIASIAAALAWNEARLTRTSADKNAAETLKEQQKQDADSAVSQQKALDEQEKEAERTYGIQQQSFQRQTREANRTFELQRQSLQAQVDSMNREQRPYVYILPGEIETIRQGSETVAPTVHFVAAVSGRTPAVDIKLFAKCYILPTSFKLTFPLPTTDAANIASFARAEDKVAFEVNKCSNLDIGGTPFLFDHRDEHLMVFGSVTYRDTLFPDVTHHSPFCYMALNVPTLTIERTRMELCDHLPGTPFD